MVENLDRNLLGGLLVKESEGVADVLVVDSFSGFLVSAAEWHSLVFHRNLTIGTLVALDDNVADSLIGGVSNDLLFLEDEHTWLVVVDNGDAGAGVLADEAMSRLGVDKLNIEVLIGLPGVVVDNLDSNFALGLAIGEIDNGVNSYVIFGGLGVAIDGTHAHLSWLFRLVEHLNFNAASSFADGVVEAAEAEVCVALVVFEDASLLVLAMYNRILRDGLSLVVDGDSLAMADSLDEGRTIQLAFKLVLVDL